MKRNNQFIFLLLHVALLLLLQSCTKERQVEEHEYAKIEVVYKNFDQAPDIELELDNGPIGSLNAGQSKTELMIRTGETNRLSIKRLSTGALLLDTVFQPQQQNKFTVWITDLLKIAAFYTQPVISPDSTKLRVLNNTIVQGAGRKVNFKFFRQLNRTLTGFEELAGYELRNVEYGKLSELITLPKVMMPAGQPQTQTSGIYIKTYDAQTGQLLIDLKTGTTNATYGRVLPATSTGSLNSILGKFFIVNVISQETGGSVSYVAPMSVYSM